MMSRTGNYRLFVFALLAAGIGLAGAAAAEREMQARDVFRAARDRFFEENPKAKAPAPAVSEAKPKRAPATSRPEQPQPPKPQAEERPTVRPVVNAPLGLRYSLLRQTGPYAAEEVDVDTVFRSGDRIKIRLESTDMAYLYILAKGASGRWRVLFPSARIAGGAHRVRPDESLSVPPSGWFAFDEQAGQEKVFVMLSRRKVEDLDQAIERLRNGTSQPVEAAPTPEPEVRVMLAMHRAGARDLVFEKVSADSAGAERHGAKAENAAYVVTKSAGPDSQVVAELTLEHR